jgi:hypothetical protein
MGGDWGRILELLFSNHFKICEALLISYNLRFTLRFLALLNLGAIFLERGALRPFPKNHT